MRLVLNCARVEANNTLTGGGGMTAVSRALRRAVRFRREILLTTFLTSVLVALAAAANAPAANEPAAPQVQGPTTEQAMPQWQHSIRVLPLPSGGCFNASYPEVQWHKVACTTAPNYPQLPAQGSFDQEVGNDNDYSAEVSGKITSAIGSFPSVSSGASETGVNPNTNTAEANTFTLQLNSNFFSSPACKGHGKPSKCKGWEQFIYADSAQENLVYMQYWLLKYNKTCPSGWQNGEPRATEISCFMNSKATTLSGGRLTAAGLMGTTFEGSADVNGNDAVVLTTESGNATATDAGNVLSLGKGWKAAEFAVVGDCCRTTAAFSANTTLTVQTVVKSKSNSAPKCISEGFTGETNNLNLEGTPALSPQPFPTIASQQTNGSATTASCATIGATPTAKATANIQGGNGACGENQTGDPVLGTVKFTRKENVLDFVAVLKHGEPNQEYGVDIAGNGCEFLGRTGEFTTNGNGVGKSQGSVEVPPGDTEFFADVDPYGFNEAPANDTPYVSLP